LARIRDEYALFQQRGAEVLATGPNTEAAFRQYWEKESLPFTGLPDPDHRIAVMYRQRVNLFKLGRMPLLCIIDLDGHIRYAHSGASMADIPENQILLDVIDELAGTSN
jgi:peroxiredoxin Q/BCP